MCERTMKLKALVLQGSIFLSSILVAIFYHPEDFFWIIHLVDMFFIILIQWPWTLFEIRRRLDFIWMNPANVSQMNLSLLFNSIMFNKITYEVLHHSCQNLSLEICLDNALDQSAKENLLAWDLTIHDMMFAIKGPAVLFAMKSLFIRITWCFSRDHLKND